MGRRAVPPPHVLSALHTLLGDAVRHVSIIEHSMLVRLHPRAVATTRRRRIYLRGSAEDFFTNPSLMLHEYCHVVLQWEPRVLTSLRYVLEWMRRGYWDNRFEIEAREFAADNLYRFRGLLSRSAEQGFPVVKPASEYGEQRPER